MMHGRFPVAGRRLATAIAFACALCVDALLRGHDRLRTYSMTHQSADQGALEQRKQQQRNACMDRKSNQRLATESATRLRVKLCLGESVVHACRATANATATAFDCAPLATGELTPPPPLQALREPSICTLRDVRVQRGRLPHRSHNVRRQFQFAPLFDEKNGGSGGAGGGAPAGIRERGRIRGANTSTLCGYGP